MPDTPETSQKITASDVKKWVRLACNLFSTIIIAVLLVIVSVLYLPKLLGFREYNVLTGSMLPDYPIGSMVYVKEIPFEELKTDDVISYYINSDTVATHRIVELFPEEKKIVTKGDANTNKDAPISDDKVIGRVDFKVPYLGAFAVWLKTKAGLRSVILLFGVSVALIVVADLLSDKKAKRGTNSEIKNKNKES